MYFSKQNLLGYKQGWYWDVEKEQTYQNLYEQKKLNLVMMKIELNNYELTKLLPRKEELKDLPNF